MTNMLIQTFDEWEKGIKNNSIKAEGDNIVPMSVSSVEDSNAPIINLKAKTFKPFSVKSSVSPSFQTFNEWEKTYTPPKANTSKSIQKPQRSLIDKVIGKIKNPPWEWFSNPPSRAVRNKNPFNIKIGGFTQKWIDKGLATIDPSPSTDGGSFLRFKNLSTGFEAGRDLLKSDIYKDLSVDDAMRKWSGGGYGDEIAPEFRNKKIKDLNDIELDGLMFKMAKEEGFLKPKIDWTTYIQLLREGKEEAITSPKYADEREQIYQEKPWMKPTRTKTTAEYLPMEALKFVPSLFPGGNIIQEAIKKARKEKDFNKGVKAFADELHKGGVKTGQEYVNIFPRWTSSLAYAPISILTGKTPKSVHIPGLGELSTYQTKVEKDVKSGVNPYFAVANSGIQILLDSAIMLGIAQGVAESITRKIPTSTMTASNARKTLGVSKLDSPETIRHSFWRLARKYHPDKPGGNEVLFKKISKAYGVLTGTQPKLTRVQKVAQFLTKDIFKSPSVRSSAKPFVSKTPTAQKQLVMKTPSTAIPSVSPVITAPSQSTSKSISPVQTQSLRKPPASAPIARKRYYLEKRDGTSYKILSDRQINRFLGYPEDAGIKVKKIKKSPKKPARHPEEPARLPKIELVKKKVVPKKVKIPKEIKNIKWLTEEQKLKAGKKLEALEKIKPPEIGKPYREWIAKKEKVIKEILKTPIEIKPIPKELESLAKEARKYKSAEKFYNKIRKEQFELLNKEIDISKEKLKFWTPNYPEEIAKLTAKSKARFGLITKFLSKFKTDKEFINFYNQAVKGVEEAKPEIKPKIEGTPKELEPLAKEARKYKSVEGFEKKIMSLRNAVEDFEFQTNQNIRDFIENIEKIKRFRRVSPETKNILINNQELLRVYYTPSEQAINFFKKYADSDLKVFWKNIQKGTSIEQAQKNIEHFRKLQEIKEKAKAKQIETERTKEKVENREKLRGLSRYATHFSNADEFKRNIENLIKDEFSKDYRYAQKIQSYKRIPLSSPTIKRFVEIATEIQNNISRILMGKPFRRDSTTKEIVSQLPYGVRRVINSLTDWETGTGVNYIINPESFLKHLDISLKESTGLSLSDFYTQAVKEAKPKTILEKARERYEAKMKAERFAKRREKIKKVIAKKPKKVVERPKRVRKMTAEEAALKDFEEEKERLLKSKKLSRREKALWASELEDLNRTEYRTAISKLENIAKHSLTTEEKLSLIKESKRLFGDKVKVQIVSNILTPEGLEAVGSYKNQIIKILDNKITAFPTLGHEAVHAYRNLFLTRAENRAITHFAKEKYSKKLGRKITNNEADEFVAEGINDYTATGKGFWGRLKALIDRFISRIKSWFRKGDKIKNLYKDILKGEGRYKTMVRAEKGKFITKYRSNLSPEEIGKIISSKEWNSDYGKVMDLLQNKKPIPRKFKNIRDRLVNLGIAKLGDITKEQQIILHKFNYKGLMKARFGVESSIYLSKEQASKLVDELRKEVSLSATEKAEKYTERKLLIRDVKEIIDYIKPKKPVSEETRVKDLENFKKVKKDFSVYNIPYYVEHMNALRIVESMQNGKYNGPIADKIIWPFERGFDKFISLRNRTEKELKTIAKDHNTTLGKLSFATGFKSPKTWWQKLTQAERIKINLAKYDMDQSYALSVDGLRTHYTEKHKSGPLKLTRKEQKVVWENSLPVEKEIAKWYVEKGKELYPLIQDTLHKLGLPKIDNIPGYSDMDRVYRIKPALVGTEPEDVAQSLASSTFGQMAWRKRYPQKQFTIPRLEGITTGRELNGDAISNMLRNIEKKAYFIHCAVPAKKNIVLLNNPYLRDAIISKFGKVRYENLQGWANSLLSPHPMYNVGDRWILKYTGNAMRSIVVGKITSSLFQAVSLPLGVGLLGPGSTPHIFHTIQQMAVNPLGVRKFVYKTFPQAKNRFMMPVLSEIRNSMASSYMGEFKNKLLHAGTSMAQFFDKVVVPLLYTAYNTELAKSGDPKLAYQAGMSMLKETQPMSAVKDIPKILGGGDKPSVMKRIMGIFRNYLTQYSMFFTENVLRPDRIYKNITGNKATKIFKTASSTAWQALIGIGLTALISFMWSHKRRPKTKMDWLEVSTMPLAGFFGIGHIRSALFVGMTAYSTLFDSFLSRSIWAIKSATSKEEEKRWKAIKYLTELAAMAYGMPFFRQAEITTGAIIERIKGENPSFWRYIDSQSMIEDPTMLTPEEKKRAERTLMNYLMGRSKIKIFKTPHIKMPILY